MLSMWSKRLDHQVPEGRVDNGQNGTTPTRQLLWSVKGHRTTRYLREEKARVDNVVKAVRGRSELDKAHPPALVEGEGPPDHQVPEGRVDNGQN